MKYIYGEGVRARRDPQQLKFYVYREGWKPWRFWIAKTLNWYFHKWKRVPLIRSLIFEVWCTRYEVSDAFRPDERDYLADIPWEHLRPDRQRTWEPMYERFKARSAHPRSKW